MTHNNIDIFYNPQFSMQKSVASDDFITGNGVFTWDGRRLFTAGAIASTLFCCPCVRPARISVADNNLQKAGLILASEHLPMRITRVISSCVKLSNPAPCSQMRVILYIGHRYSLTAGVSQGVKTNGAPNISSAISRQVRGKAGPAAQVIHFMVFDVTKDRILYLCMCFFGHNIAMVTPSWTTPLASETAENPSGSTLITSSGDTGFGSRFGFGAANNPANGSVSGTASATISSNNGLGNDFLGVGT